MVIFADFNNRDASGCLRLNNFGTLRDIEIHSLAMAEGMVLRVSDGDLAADIVVRCPGEEGVWRGEIISDIVFLS